jgi:hypothetical protein
MPVALLTHTLILLTCKLKSALNSFSNKTFQGGGRKEHVKSEFPISFLWTVTESVVQNETTLFNSW